MTREELTAQLDKVIGSKGIARIPAWWLKRLFKDTADYAEDKAEKIGSTKRNIIGNLPLESSTQSLKSGYQYKGEVPFTIVDLHIDSSGFKEVYVQFMLSESDDVSYAISGDDEIGGIVWVEKPETKKNTEYAVTILGNMAWAAARPMNHIRIRYNITDISLPTTMFNKTGSVALFLLDGVPEEMSEQHKFETTGIHTVDIYDTSIALAKVLNGIPEIVDVKLWTYGGIGSDIESLFEGTSIRTANFTEYRCKHQGVIYGQTFEDCKNLNERYLNADLRNMAFCVTDRMYNMFMGTTLETIDLSTWDLEGATGLSSDEGIFPGTLKRLIVGTPEDLDGDVGFCIPEGTEVIIASEREPYAVFYNPDGTMYKEMTAEELTSLPVVPTLEGYASAGWNLTLDEIKTRLDLYGHCEVGAVYSRSTSIAKVTIPEDKLVGCLYLAATNKGFKAMVDWGDGSELESITLGATSTTEGKYDLFKHQYSQAGEYEIKITRSAGYLSSAVFRVYADTETTNYTTITLLFLVVGDGFTYVTQIESAAFPIVGRHLTECGCYFSDKLSYLSIPSGIESMKYGGAMTDGTTDYDLLNIVLPESITFINGGWFRRAKYLQGIIFPTGLTTIGANAFESCFSMRKVVFPPALTTIGSRAFADCFRCSVYDFTKVSQVPEIAADAFPPLTEEYVILVSSEMYDDFVKANMTAHWVSRIFKA